MRKPTALLAIAAGPLLVAGAANAQSTSGTSVGGAPAAEPGVTVQGPERLVCLLVRRTGTRMRSSRVCRTVGQWQEARAGRSQDQELAEAADTLDALGADDMSTNDQTAVCADGTLQARMHDTPLGPR